MLTTQEIRAILRAKKLAGEMLNARGMAWLRLYMRLEALGEVMPVVWDFVEVR